MLHFGAQRHQTSLPNAGMGRAPHGRPAKNARPTKRRASRGALLPNPHPLAQNRKPRFAKARRHMVVEQPRSLQQGVNGDAADKGKASFFEILRQKIRLGGANGNLACPGPLPHNRLVADLPPKIRNQAAVLVDDAVQPSRVFDRGPDLALMTNDPGIGHQALHVAFAKIFDRVAIEIRESRPEVFALVQNREPAQSGLKAFQQKKLVQGLLVDDRRPPLLIVIATVRVAFFAPRAPGFAAFFPGFFWIFFSTFVLPHVWPLSIADPDRPS